jgi:hypothetical protein
MKWSVLATLFAAPLALAGILEADLVVRTDSKGNMESSYNNGSGGGSTVIIEEVVIIWVCHGAGSATTTMNTMASETSAKGAVATHTVCAFFIINSSIHQC